MEGETSRLDLFLQSQTGKSRTFVQEQIEAGNVSQNGRVIQKASQKVHAGDTITGILNSESETDLEPIEHPLSILYEDDYFLCLNKEQGTVVHPAAGHRGETLVHYLLYYLKNHAPFKEFPPERPGIVHRLDRGTSGVLLVAKDRKNQDLLQSLFKNRQITKEYEAVVWGTPRKEGRFQSVIGRDKRDRKKMSSQTATGRDALTLYKTLETFSHFSHMALHPKTGRTHQLRVHLTEAGFPIVGDTLYGAKTLSKRTHVLPQSLKVWLESVSMTFLHAKALAFKHPITGKELRVEAKRPEIFDKFLELLKNDTE